MNGKRFEEGKARKNGFYLALAICLVAVGIAAWSTYDAVQSYAEPETSNTSALQSQKNEDVRSGQEKTPSLSAQNDDPEAPENKGNAGAKATTGTVERPTATLAPTPTPVPKEEEPAKQDEGETGVPVNAGTLYEITTEWMYPTAAAEAVNAYSSGKPVYSKTMKDWRIHAGADLAAQPEEAVKACGNGLVKRVYTDNLLGNVVEVEHGDFVFSYCGVGENFLVKEGDLVTKGQQIAVVTAVPSEAGEDVHLHLEVKRDEAYLDPVSILDGKI